MATVVIIDPETGEEDRKLPEYLAGIAKLAAQAYANKQDEFECPCTGKMIKVSMIRHGTGEPGVTVEDPGVEVLYKGTLWQCWSGGITSRNNEYFPVRARDPLFYTIGKKGYSANPNIKAYGNIFVNDTPDGKKRYNMSLKTISQAAKNELAEKLVGADMVSASEVMGIDDDVDFNTPTKDNQEQRSSNVRLGQ